MVLKSLRTARRYKNVKCSLRSILLDNSSATTVLDAIEKRCLAVSQMNVKGFHLCRLMVESLIEMERKQTGMTVEWPDFAQLKTFVQLLTKGRNVRPSTKPTPAIDFAWNLLPQNYPLSFGRFHSDYNLITYCAKTFQTKDFAQHEEHCSETPNISNAI